MANRYARSSGARPTPSVRRRAVNPSRLGSGSSTQGAYTMATGCPPGQHLRGGKQIIAIGGPAPTVIAPGATATMVYQIPESGRLMRLLLSADTGTLAGVTLDALEHNNTLLTSQIVPAEMFSDVTVGGSNPIIGRWVLVNDNVQITITNNTAAAVTITSAFSVA